MSKNDETIILGAGLAGMVASIVLAKEGRKVRIIEGAKEIGGDMGLHPSLHGTPIDIEKVEAWTGLDTKQMFVKGNNNVQMFIGSQCFHQNPVYVVERGNRPSSIDTYLFGQAKELGVEFEFGRYVKDPKELPKGSIIATGFHPFMFNAMDIPSCSGGGFSKVVKNDDPSLEGNVYGWIGSYTNEYAYACVLNGIKYVLLFSRFGLPQESLDEFKKHLKDTVGWEFDDWSSLHNVPIPWSTKRPQLWVDDYILTGTVGGIIDPMGGFGIQGAILSGAVAAWAITDPERAEREIKNMNKHFTSATLSFEATKSMPFRETFFKMIFVVPEVFRPILAFMGRGIPGYDGNWAYDIIKGYHKGRGLGKRFVDLGKIFRS